MFVVSNARDNGISKGRLKNRIVMDVCEFCYSPINSLYQKCVSNVELSEGGSCDIKDMQNPCNYSLQGFCIRYIIKCLQVTTVCKNDLFTYVIVSFFTRAGCIFYDHNSNLVFIRTVTTPSNDSRFRRVNHDATFYRI